MTEKKPILIVLFTVLVILLLASLGGLYYFYTKSNDGGESTDISTEDEDDALDLAEIIENVVPTYESIEGEVIEEKTDDSIEVREFDVDGVLMKDFIEAFEEEYGDDMDNISDFYYFEDATLLGTAEYRLFSPTEGGFVQGDLTVSISVGEYGIGFILGAEALGGACDPETEGPCCDTTNEASGISFWTDGGGVYQGGTEDGVPGMYIAMEDSVFDSICTNKTILDSIFSKLKKL